MKRAQRPNADREKTTKKEWRSDCKRYNSCERAEKYQGRCNSRCCSAYKQQK